MLTHAISSRMILLLWWWFATLLLVFIFSDKLLEVVQAHEGHDCGVGDAPPNQVRQAVGQEERLFGKAVR